MKGPVPKDPKIRQRRNRVTTQSTLDAASDGRRRRPSLPAGINWHPMTVAWWRDVWRSPMAREFLEADKHALFRMAILIDRFWLEPTKELGAEIRLEQQAFGLTPIDRRRLQWSMDNGRENTDTRKVAVSQPSHENEVDPRNLLTWVVAPEPEPVPVQDPEVNGE